MKYDKDAEFEAQVRPMIDALVAKCEELGLPVTCIITTQCERTAVGHGYEEEATVFLLNNKIHSHATSAMCVSGIAAMTCSGESDSPVGLSPDRWIQATRASYMATNEIVKDQLTGVNH